jgi:hypothetical protein
MLLMLVLVLLFLAKFMQLSRISDLSRATRVANDAVAIKDETRARGQR